MSHKRRRVTRGENESSGSLTSRYSPLVAYLVIAMEAVLLALVCLSPWAYGAVHPSFEFLLDAGIAVLLALWAARMLVEGQITWKNSAVAICLAGLFLLALWQTTPLPRRVLAWLSLGTVRSYDQLLPQQPEALPDDTAYSDATTRPGSTLSLYPGATQREAGRLLAVFLVFVVVYNNLTSKEALIRLSWAVLINGALLSLFALFQLFAAPAKKIYWIFSSQVTPFGPFICKNHFPDYVNMGIGLGIGLLLSQSSRDRSSPSFEQDGSPLQQLLRNPRALWIGGALGLMITAVAFSRSRGGLLALVGAAVLCALLGRVRLGLSFRLGFITVVAGIVVALSAWFGIDLVKNRMATLETGEAFESRVPLWLRSLPIVPNFPIWGSGFGTFGYVEPMYRKDAPSNELLAWYHHAHSDYLEMLVEGGVVGLCLALLALAAIYRSSFRALVVNRGSSRAGLALGALFGFTALALHSIGEFGAHIPAVMLLATVVSAHLCALGSPKPHKSRSRNKEKSLSLAPASGLASDEKNASNDEYRIRLGGVAPMLGAILALAFGLVLCSDTWKFYRIDRLQAAAFRAGNADADQLRTRIAFLTEAVSLSPEDAQLHTELGKAHEQRFMILYRGNLSDRPEAIKEGDLALQEYLRARDACPLLSEAQVGIAAFASRLKRGDDAEAYLHRAKELAPGQPEMLFLCGLVEFNSNHRQEAWKTWRHCLELSDRYLPQILNQTSQLKPDQLMEEVLPDNPEILLAAALSLYPDFETVGSRRPFLEKALRLLESKEEEPGSQDLLVKARIYKALDQPDQAIPLYQELLKRPASPASLRYEFASYLHEVGKLEEARHELTVILARDPKNGAAKKLHDAVLQEMLQEKSQQRQRQRADWWSRHRQQQQR